MDARIDELERLAALHRSGVLTDDEFAAAKAKSLNGPPSAAVGPRAAAPTGVAPAQLSKTWQRRFAFYDEHGSPMSGQGAMALRKLPFWTAMSIRSNIWGLIFGPLYWFVLGLWKRGLALGGLALVASYISAWLFGDRVGGLVSVGFQVFGSMTVNYARYIKVTQGRDEWNPFADVFTGALRKPGAEA